MLCFAFAKTPPHFPDLPAVSLPDCVVQADEGRAVCWHGGDPDRQALLACGPGVRQWSPLPWVLSAAFCILVAGAGAFSPFSPICGQIRGVPSKMSTGSRIALALTPLAGSSPHVRAELSKGWQFQHTVATHGSIFCQCRSRRLPGAGSLQLCPQLPHLT